MPEDSEALASTTFTLEELEYNKILDTLHKTDWRIKGPQGNGRPARPQAFHALFQNAEIGHSPPAIQGRKVVLKTAFRPFFSFRHASGVPIPRSIDS